MMELADFNIQLWMDLKANIRSMEWKVQRFLTGIQHTEAFLFPPYIRILSGNNMLDCQFFR